MQRVTKFLLERWLNGPGYRRYVRELPQWVGFDRTDKLIQDKQ